MTPRTIPPRVLRQRLWDCAVRISRKHRQQHTSILRSKAARLANWRRWKREAAIKERMAEVEVIARRESRRFVSHLDLHDLVQAGCVGLVDAANKYHPDRGKFEAYAYFRIKGAVIDANKRRAYREELNVSIQEFSDSRDGWLPPHLDRCTAPLPDAVMEREQALRRVQEATAGLSRKDQRLLQAWSDGATVREQCKVSGLNQSQTRDRVVEILAAVREAVRVRAGCLPRH